MRSSDNENKPTILTLILIFLIVFIAGKMFSSDFSSDFTLKSPTNITTNTNIPNINYDLNLTKLELPENGKTNYYLNSEAIAPFSISTNKDHNYFIKLVDADTNKTALTVFVHGGNSVNIKVPLGNYELRYAAGDNWYGDEHLFGSNTSYCKADTILSFYINGHRIMGHTVQLVSQLNGNMPTSKIDKDEF